MKNWLIAIAILFGLSAINACAPAVEEEENAEVESLMSNKEEEASTLAEASIQLAQDYYDSIHAVLINQEGDRVGVASFTETSEGVEIELDGWDLPPGEHGFHIHENGSCEVPSFESAGGHFNPTDAQHGFDNPKGPHAGDLPNVEVDENGRVHAKVLGEMLSIQEGAKNTIVIDGGTSIMLHAGPDDYISQPAGDSGDRIACGTIQ